ncbi:MAG TPA: hypothetical protein VGK58_15350 [Lacipirellulaceae bacterium]
MSSSYESALASAGAEQPVRERIDQILKFLKELDVDNVDDIFISEYLDQSGGEKRRVYESLMVFSAGYIHEAKNFLHSYNVDSLNLAHFTYWQVEKTDLDDVNKPQATSRILVTLSTLHMMGCTLKASGENCKTLLRLFKKHIASRAPNQVLS